MLWRISDIYFKTNLRWKETFLVWDEQFCINIVSNWLYNGPAYDPLHDLQMPIPFKLKILFIFRNVDNMHLQYVTWLLLIIRFFWEMFYKSKVLLQWSQCMLNMCWCVNSKFAVNILWIRNNVGWPPLVGGVSEFIFGPSPLSCRLLKLDNIFLGVTFPIEG